MVSIAFLSDREMAALNRRHLNHRGPTDVISFGFAPGAKNGPVVGDVYIAPGIARRNARAHGRGVREETMRLVVHGVLHVLGYDHPADESRYDSAMWRRQERLLRSALAAA
jgi:probable rRNA maturation factor